MRREFSTSAARGPVRGRQVNGLLAGPRAAAAKLHEQLATWTTLVESACECVPFLLLLEVGDESYGGLPGLLRRVGSHSQGAGNRGSLVEDQKPFGQILRVFGTGLGG